VISDRVISNGWRTLAVVLAGVLVGCGGGADSADSGGAVFTVVWPESTRLIPEASQSIRVEIRRNNVAVATRVIPRPVGGGSASADFQNLPVGPVSAIATAHPQADGAGVAQASGSVAFTVQAGQTIPFTLNMGSTIDRIEVNPPSVDLNPAQTQPLGITARNAANQIVLVAANKLEWESLNTGVARVDSSGVVTAVSAGSTQVRVRDTESSKIGTATVNVSNPAETVVYWNDFETSVGSEWSNPIIETSPFGRKFLGRFNTSAETLTLSLPANTTQVTLSFKVYIIYSWDGNGNSCCGPDIFDLSIEGGPTLLRTSFSNTEAAAGNLQSYPDAFGTANHSAGTGSSEMGTLGWFGFDTVYTLRYTVPYTASSIRFRFASTLTKGIDDESWGIDDIEVRAKH